jgi:cyanophycin synthetase
LLERALDTKGYVLEFDETSPATATYVSPSGAKWITRAAHIAYPFTSEKARDISIHKKKTHEFALERGFPVPHTVMVGEAGIANEEARQLLDRYKTLIVKPADASLSRGLTMAITSYEQLIEAVRYAKTFSSNVLIQQQVEGEEIRFTLLQGKVEAALLRQTPRVVGDGASTIAELIKRENEHRRQLRLEYVTYPQLDETLIDSKFLASTQVPSKEEIVELNRSTMIRGGCSVYNILDNIDDSYIQKIESLTAGLGADFIVADVFCSDFTLPAADGNYQLIEFNTAPALKLYYGCRDGKQFDIARRLATMIDTHLQG